jgi:hypothetical protein
MHNKKYLWLVLIGFFSLVLTDVEAADPSYAQQVAALRKKKKDERVAKIRKKKLQIKKVNEQAAKVARATKKRQKKQQQREALAALRAKEDQETASILAGLDAQLNAAQAKKEAARTL